MSRITTSIAPVLAAGAAAAMFSFAPPASAAPGQCANSGLSTVCESPGNSEITVIPSESGGVAGGANEQNGVYGPSGNRPPVGN